MGWLSRTNSSDVDGTAGATASTPTAPAAPSSPTTGPASPIGRYGPLVTVTRFDSAPPELEWQLPLSGELYRLIPGSDRPDYSLLVLDRPLHFYPHDGFDLGRVEADQRVQDRKGRTMVRVHALLLCSRFVGQQLHPGMTDLAVNLAYVIDNSLARDAEVDFAKIEFAGTGFLDEGRPPAPEAPEAPVAAPQPAGQASPESTPAPEPAPTPEPTPGPEPTPEPTPELVPEPTPATEQPAPEPVAPATAETAAGSRHTPSDVLDELARTLRGGIEQQRGAPVRRMTAALTLDPELRLTGLSGNADGQAPVPTPETFGRMAEVLGRLTDVGGVDRIAALTLRADGDSVSHEVTATHG